MGQDREGRHGGDGALRWLLFWVAGLAGLLVRGSARSPDPLVDEVRDDARTERRLLGRELLIVAFVVALVVARAMLF